ncbi:MAG: DNA-directed RNA polymerase subunit P [Candidatus Pacearchaeota archaeon]|jgi:DNA-directed RNA polymerase subunit RPC12/RpoP
MAKCICSHCGFRCDMQNPIDCPYCGRKTLEKERSAVELLDEVNDILEE